jgi:hypothetical protein
MSTKTAVYSICIAGLVAYPMNIVFADDDAGESSGHRHDYAAAVGGGGIDLYATTKSGVKLVKGSPFVPDPVPTGINGDPAPTPADVVIDSPQRHVYARYDTTFSGHPDLLWSFRVTETGLKQDESTTYPYGGFGEHAAPNVQFVGATEHFVYLTNFNVETGLNVLTLYRVNEGHFKGYVELDLRKSAGPNEYVASLPTAIHIDSAEHFLFVCYSNGEEIQSTSGYSLSPPAVAVFHIEGTGPTLVANSMNSEYVAAQCP